MDILKNNDLVNSDCSAIIVHQEAWGTLTNGDIKKQVNIRSIAKTILAIACGILIDNDENFTENIYIYPIVKDKVNLTNIKNEKYLKQIKVKHLLSQTIGYRDVLLMSKDMKKMDTDNVLNELINYPIHYKPGTHFLYSNASYYILSAVIEEYLGYNFFNFLDEKLFKPLNIKNIKADKYGQYLVGASKMYMSAEDMVKIAEVILNKGIFKDKQIVSNTRIDKMIRPKYKNKNEDNRTYLSQNYYGYSLWISKEGIIFASGTGGQLVVIDQKSDTIIVTTNSGSANNAYKIKNNVEQILKLLDRS